jgi:sodium transport system permease protein
MIHGSAIICRKELLEICRDKRTLIFVLLLPMAAIPLLSAGSVKFAEKMARKRAVYVVNIAATPDSSKAYRNMVYDWFIESDIGSSLKMANSPIFKAIAGPGDSGLSIIYDEVPAEIFKDPEALQQWSHDLAINSRDMPDEKTGPASDGPVPVSMESLDSMPEEWIAKARTFYEVTIQGLGLVKFIDPSTLQEPPADFHPQDLSAELDFHPDIRRIAWAIQQRQIQGFLDTPSSLRKLHRDLKKEDEITFIYDSTIPLSNEARTRLNHAVRAYRDLVVKSRLHRLGHDESILKPVELRTDMNLATMSEEVVAQVAGFLPYMIIMFAFMGGMSPAIDMGAGEKERQTLETLLLAGCSRTELALGKFLAIFTANLTAALLSVISLGITLVTMVTDEMKEYLQIEFNPLHMTMIGILMLPMAATFAGILLALSIYARSAKEAQSYISPIMILLILPAVAAMFPDIEVDGLSAMIPLFNVSLLMREVLKGEIYPAAYMITMLSSILVATACLSYAVWQFRREQVLFRF